MLLFLDINSYFEHSIETECEQQMTENISKDILTLLIIILLGAQFSRSFPIRVRVVRANASRLQYSMCKRQTKNGQRLALLLAGH